MSEFSIDNAKLDIDPSGIAVLQRAFDKREDSYQKLEAKYNTDSAEAKGKIESLATKLETANAKIEVLEGKIQERNDADSSFPKKIRERLKLHKDALLHCDGLTEDDLFEMSDRQIKEKIINIDGLEDRSEEVIQGMYEVSIKNSQRRDDSFQRQKDLVGNIVPKDKIHEDSAEDPYELQKQAYENAWQWAVTSRGGKQ